MTTFDSSFRFRVSAAAAVTIPAILGGAVQAGDPVQLDFEILGMSYGVLADGWLDPGSSNYNAIEVAAEAGRRIVSADWSGLVVEACYNDGATATNWASEL
ncbi:MAG: hypothetical protein ACYTDE_09000, partial [Planctomycetota bacterium]